MKSSEILIEAVKGFEGYAGVAYKCPAGLWTIGYGHTRGVAEGDKCTEEEAEVWLKEDLAACEEYVKGLGVKLTQGKFDSLVDFAYNCGTGNLEKSTLLKKVRTGAKDAVIQDEFRKWVYSGGRKLQGLVKRRDWEARRWVQ